MTQRQSHHHHHEDRRRPARTRGEFARDGAGARGAGLLRLQRLAGNAAVTAAIVQRAASRSVAAKLENATQETLHQTTTTLSHGVWTAKPTGQVKPGATAAWSSESSGFMTGTEGAVEYSIEGATPTCRLTWNNPFIGSNTVTATAPPGYKVTHTPMTGSNTAVTYKLTSDRKVVTIGTEKVNVANDAEKQQAEAIIKAIKDDYGITVSSSSGVSAVKARYTNVPAAVTGAVSEGVWELKELVALKAALAHFAPILGKLRAASTQKGTAQEITTVGKVKQSIDTNSPSGVLDTTTLGEFFGKDKNFSMFDAGTKSTVDFADTRKQLEGTAVHEIAHGLFGGEVGNYIAALDYWTDRNTKSGKPGAEAPISTYGQTNASEDLSEAVMFYFMDEIKLKTTCPKRHAFVKGVIAAWKPPPPATTP